MRLSKTGLLLATSIMLLVTSSVGQRLPICDVDCTPNPASPTFGQAVSARTRIPNLRRPAPIVATFGPPGLIVKAQLGSRSYSYSTNLLSLPGRNNLNVDLTLFYNSRVWSRGANGLTLNVDRDTPSYGFRLDYGFIELNPDTLNYVLTEKDGAKHELVSTATANLYVSHDSTYIQFDATSNVWKLTYRDGVQTFYQPFGDGTVLRPTTIEDNNGNLISIAYANSTNLSIATITDTVGRVITFSYDLNGRLQSVSQGNKTITFGWNASYVLNYSFSVAVTDSPVSGSVQPVLTSVTLPNGTSINYIYGDWGIVNRIERRSSSGAVRAYVAHNLPPATAAQADSPAFTQETAFDGTNTATWSYAAVENANGMVTSMTVTDPSGTSTTTTFSSAGDWKDGLPLTDQVKDSTGRIWHTTNNTWVADDTTTGANPRRSVVATTLEDGSSSQVQYSYDANGNMTDTKAFDFNGTLLQEKVTSFASLGGNILNRPSQVLVKNGLGNVVARTDYVYDEYASFPLTGYSPAPVQHDEARYSTTGTVRGNVTTTIDYKNASAGTGGVVQHFRYDTAGNRLSSQLDCCVQKQWTYTSATQYAYPSTVVTGPPSNSLSVSTTMTYNMASGTLATIKDANGQTTSFTYDTSDRMTVTQNPDLSTVTQAYDDAGASASESISKSQNSMVEVAVTDGLGRTIAKQIKNGTALVSSVTTNYDLLGRVASTSNPFGPGEVPVYTTYQYDALGRSTSVSPPGNTGSFTSSYSGAAVTTSDPAGKQHREFKNALGSLIQVDEPGLSGAAAGTGSITITGTEKSAPTSSGNGASAGTASVTLSGSERSTQVLTHAATTASTTITITGTEQSTTVSPGGGCTPPMPCCIAPLEREFRYIVSPEPALPAITIWDSGTVTVTIGGIAKSVPYGQSDTGTTLASKLVTAFSGASSTFRVSSSGNVLTVTASSAGAAGNSITVSGTSATSDPVDFGGPSFAPASASSTLVGGTDNSFTTVFDTGTATVSVTANGATYSKTSNYGQSSTLATIAADLANQINADTVMNKVIVASSSSGVLNLTTVATGANTAYGLSSAAVTNNSNFAAGSSSFTATASGTAFTPGQNGTVWDAGTLTVTITGFSTSPYQRTANYSQGSTAASIASAIAGAFNADLSSPVSATASANVVTLTAKSVGADTNYGVSASVVTTQSAFFATPSFSATSASLTGGQDGTASLSSPLSTLYTYDALGNLLQITQGQQVRRYAYDGMSHLLSASLPETGNAPITLTYNSFGAVATRTDARGVVSTYGYDVLNRVTNVAYSDGTPSVTYTYGGTGAANFGAGRLIQVTDAIGTQTMQYDAMGRTIQQARTAGSITYTTRFGYSSGQLSTITYPSGRTVTHGLDPMGRLLQVGSNGSSVLNIGGYNAANQVLSYTFGNGMQSTYTYNSQMQLVGLTSGSTSTPVLNLSYNFGAQNNGQIQTITDNLDSTRSTSYVYDELGRLKTGQTSNQTSANSWKLKFNYDRYGNRLSEVPTGGAGSMPMSQTSVDPTTNRIIGLQYDGAGNILNDGLHTYTYDAENRIMTVDGTAATFAYDASGLRAKKNGTLYIYVGPQPIAEYSSGASATSPAVEYIYGDSRMVASVAAGVFTYYYPDHLSNRALANSAGTQTGTTNDFPFGESLYQTGATTKWKFTTYEGDRGAGESGLDYASARFYSSRIGRFTTVDPLSGTGHDPQSFNHYAYSLNDPINRIDPSGRMSGNFMCLLDEHGDCVGGDYAGSGLSIMNPLGMWADPFGPWVDPTKWNPLADGEARYDSIIHSWGNYDPATGTFLATIAVVGFYLSPYDDTGNGGFVMTLGQAGLTPDQLAQLDMAVQDIVDTINAGGIPGVFNFADNRAKPSDWDAYLAYRKTVSNKGDTPFDYGTWRMFYRDGNLGQTGATMTNPCTYALWVGGSVALAADIAPIEVGGSALLPEFADTLASSQLLKAANVAKKWLAGAIAYAWGEVKAGCNKLQ